MLLTQKHMPGKGAVRTLENCKHLSTCCCKFVFVIHELEFLLMEMEPESKVYKLAKLSLQKLNAGVWYNNLDFMYSIEGPIIMGKVFIG